MKHTKAMKLSALLLALIMTVSLLPVSVFAAPDYDLKVLTFEDSDYKGGTNFAGKSDWSSLIDEPQYGGKMLYGPGGTGFTDENEAYTWSDDNNTCLTHKFPYNYNAYCYWGGGHAISNYSTGDIADYGGFQTQLTVYKAGVKGLSRTGGGHNGSNNFAVHYGYMDGSSFNKTEVLPALSFKDGVARVIDHMYVNNTTYALNCYVNGNDLTGKIGDDDWVKLVATGYNAAGKQTGTAELYLCKGPKNIVMDWTKWDLSGLGKVVKVDFNVTGSSDNGYGFSQPAYFAYDDVAVRFEKEPVVATKVQLSQTELTMTKGETAQLTATVQPENTTDTLTWTSSAETVATVADGKVTALKAGTATITAACGSVKAECTVTVKEEAGPITVSVNGAPCTIEKVTDPSDSSKLIYRALAPYGSGVTINVKDASFLMVQDSKYGSINEEGANPFSLTAAQLEKLLVKNKGLAFTPADTSKIAYMSIMDGMTATTYDLYIELTREITPATGVTMNQDTLTLRPTQTAQLTAAVQPENTTDTLTWSTSNDTVATVADGKVTALKPGKATITAAAGNVKAECAVTVLDPIPASAVVLDKTALSLYEGDTAALTATVQPEDTTIKTVTWTSTEETVATVADGKITALKAGTTTITAACGDVKAECKVTVKAPTEPALVDGVYQIGLNSELVWFAKQVNSGKTGISCKLVNDIDLENINWTPIGNAKEFAGSIDGDGHTIKNLSVAYAVKGRERAYLGLVGQVTGTADSHLAIKNLTVEGRIDVTGSASFYSCYIGGVVGRGQYVDLSNVVSRVTVAIEKTVGNAKNVGGMAGTLVNSNVTNCGNEGDVTGSSDLGGLVQQLYSGTMAGCYNTGKVTGSGTYVGGVLAYAKQATVKDIYNTGDVTSRKSMFGGLIGVMDNASLTNAYNTGKVTATEGESSSASFGSAVGDSENLTNVYYLEGTAAKGVGKGTGEATAKTAEELKAMAATLGESFKEDATGINGGYPVLTWQAVTAITPWDGTTKTEPALVDGVYQISNAEELAWFGTQTHKSGKNGISGVLVNDIDLGGHDWYSCMIGATSSYGKGFCGTFDGAGHTIRGLAMSKSIKNDYSVLAGLFGFAQKATIKDFTVEGSITLDFADYPESTRATRSADAGVIAHAEGCNISGVISNVDISVVNDANGKMTGYVGGITPTAYTADSSTDTPKGTVIENCVNNGTISVGTEAAGIVATMSKYAVVRNCMNTGTIIASGTTSGNAAGIVGKNDAGLVEGCVNTGAIKGTSSVGGIVGWMGSASDGREGTVQNCYNTGSVYSRAAGTYSNGAGGIVGSANGYTSKKIYSNVKNCYSTGSVSFDPNGAGALKNKAYAGGITGYTYLVNANNCYYLEGTSDKSHGDSSKYYVNFTSVEAKSAADLKALAPTLGASFKADTTKINNGYPVLTWQLGEVCQHTVTEVKNAQPATCTTDGYTGDTYCKLCGAKISEGHAINALGHKLTKTEAKAATCTEKGNSEYYTCSACGKYFSDAKGENEITKGSWVIAATGHNMTKTEAKAATCTEAGSSEYYTCGTCGKYFSDAEGKNEIAKDSWIIEATGHNMTKTEAKAATCTEAGNSEYYTCSACGKYFSDAEGKNEIAKDSWVIAATGHNMTKTEAKAATCTEAGNSEYYTCSACGKYFRDAEGKNAIEKDSWVIAATGHDMTKTAAKAATCTEAGNSEYYTCGTCGKYFSDAKGENEIAKDSWIIEATGHKLTKTEAKAATCTEAGNSEYYTCSGCGKYFSDAKGENEIAKDSWVIEATGHNMTKTEAKAATCTEAGNSEYYTCSGCGKFFSDAEGKNEIAKDSWIIDALGHVEVKDAAKAATCTETGLTEGVHCSHCNTVLKAQTETPALGHVEVKDAAKAATCTETGLTEGVHCSRCNAVLKAQTETPALGHVEVKDAAKAATCTETGLTEGVHCSRCNTVLKAQTETPALGHVEVKDAAKAATCTETGLTEGVHCSRCSAVLKAQTETPALGHVEVKDAAKAATCTETGLTEGVHCSRCNAVLKAQTSTPALGHDYKNGVCTRCGAKDPNYKPAAPTISTGFVASTGKPTVKWSTVSGAAKYEVYRAATRNGTYKLMGTVTGTSYTDESAYAGYIYFYKVRVVDAGGVKGNFSTIHSAICHCAKPVVSSGYVASTGKPTIKWTAVSGATEYQVYRAATRNGTYKLMGTVTGTSYTDESADAGYIYFYKVKAVSKVRSAADSNFSAVVSATCHCAKPVVKITTSSGDPKLTWNAVTNASKYEVYRATSKTGTYTKVATTTAKSYTDKTAKAGTTYYYKVKAVSKVRPSANSAFSAIKSIKAK